MEINVLRQFVPLNALSGNVLNELAEAAEEMTLPAGHVIFKQGEKDPWLYFLLEGDIICQESDHAPRTIQAGTESGRYALSRTSPRGYSAVAATSARVFRIDEDLLESCLGSDQAAAYEVFEYDGSDDPAWMMQILSKPAFRKVPSAHANLMFERFQPVTCASNERVLQQGDPADYYYVIREGRAQVARKTSENGSLALAELGPGDGFGEEALLTGECRNATVTMLSDGVLMRLSRKDFDALLKAPLVKTVDLEAARKLMQGGAQLVDVRLEEEFKQGTLRDSLSLPLYLLRLKAQSLDTRKKYILFCQHETRSSAAAFLLTQRGLDAYVLRGGLAGLKPGT